MFAVDLRTSRVVFSLRPDVPLIPASNEKLAVTFAALVALGPSFRMRTEVLGNGRLAGRSTWRGSLVVKGYGDPTLSSAGLRRLAAQVRALGIRRVTGPIVGDESYFDQRRSAPGWKPGFLPRESPPISALVVDRGRYRGSVTPSPALAAAQLFRQALARAGIRVRGPAKTARAGGLPLGSVFSPTLDRIVRFMDTESDNFTAEMLLKQLGAIFAGAGTTAAGAAVVRSVLSSRSVPLRGVRLVDGSGLSSRDRLTARAIVAILARAWRDADLRPFFVRALAVAGRSGTLRNRLTTAPARGLVRAKTGTLREASTLAGFVGDRYAFAVIHNGSPAATAAARSAQDGFAAALAAA